MAINSALIERGDAGRALTFTEKALERWRSGKVNALLDEESKFSMQMGIASEFMRLAGEFDYAGNEELALQAMASSLEIASSLEDNTYSHERHYVYFSLEILAKAKNKEVASKLLRKALKLSGGTLNMEPRELRQIALSLSAKGDFENAIALALSVESKEYRELILGEVISALAKSKGHSIRVYRVSNGKRSRLGVDQLLIIGAWALAAEPHNVINRGDSMRMSISHIKQSLNRDEKMIAKKLVNEIKNIDR
jgi:tetratricopeptide (TPR) repeat protein